MYVLNNPLVKVRDRSVRQARRYYQGCEFAIGKVTRREVHNAGSSEFIVDIEAVRFDMPSYGGFGLFS
jgi:hypothetical protein